MTVLIAWRDERVVLPIPAPEQQDNSPYHVWRYGGCGWAEELADRYDRKQARAEESARILEEQ